MTDDQNPTSQNSVQSRFKCSSGDGSSVIIDNPPTYPGEVTISITRGKPFVVVSPDVARQVASAIMDCASRAELEQQNGQ